MHAMLIDDKTVGYIKRSVDCMRRGGMDEGTGRRYNRIVIWSHIHLTYGFWIVLWKQGSKMLQFLKSRRVTCTTKTNSILCLCPKLDFLIDKKMRMEKICKRTNVMHIKFSCFCLSKCMHTKCSIWMVMKKFSKNFCWNVCFVFVSTS